MRFDEYQAQTGDTAVYPGVGQGTAIALAYVGLGLGEAGEVQGKIKKILRDDGGMVTPEKRDAIASELGDLLWYVAQTATEIGMPLSTIAIENLNKLNSRKERGVLQGSGDNR